MRGIIGWLQTTIRVQELEGERLEAEMVAEEDRVIAEMLAEESCLATSDPIYQKLIDISTTERRLPATGVNEV